MRVEESDGKRTLLVSDDEKAQFITSVLSANKASLGKLLDPVLHGRKIDYLKIENDQWGRNVLLNLHFVKSFSPSRVPGQDEFSILILATLLPYISDSSIEQMTNFYPDTKKFVKQALIRRDYTQVMKQLNEMAAEYNAQDDRESAKIAENIGPDFSAPKLPPAGYPLAKFGSRRGTRSRKRRARKTNRRKY